MSHVHKWYLFYKTVSGDVVALCEDPACPEFLGEKEIIDRMNAVEHTLAPDGAYLCGKCGLMSRTTKCENCGHIYERPAGKA